jgi:cyclic beta-1,2-glucan synthetase
MDLVTGSAGCLYRAGLEQLLGFRVEGTNLVIDHCIPRSWRGFEIVFCRRSARYEISVDKPLGVCAGVLATKLDGVLLFGGEGRLIPLVGDGATHRVQIILGSGQG